MLLTLFVFCGALQYGIYIAYILRFGGRISTTAIAAVIMVPLRRILGFHHPRRLREAAPRGRYLAGV